MTKHSSAFGQLTRQFAKRRRDLLLKEDRSSFVPANGVAWTPSERELALCEAFIVLFVAELESYFEAILDESLDVLEKTFTASGANACGASAEFVKSIISKRQQVAKNNNANWSRISEFFIFVGLNKDRFPSDFWDDIEHVVKERGGIAHQSAGLRTITDPRLTLSRISKVYQKLKLFDRDHRLWLHICEAEISRMNGVFNRFVGGLGSINTAV